MSPSHLAMVRKLPCAICGREWPDWFIVVPHHLLRTGEHGTGRKSSDRWAIPLCGPHHTALHNNGDEESYLMNLGLDGRALASALWAVRNKPEPLVAAMNVVFKFWQAAEQKRRAA